jgi:membrane fusion protein (multidrug efflux system)
VVGADGKPQPRPVKIGSAQGTNWVVLDGLKPGEQVIVEGFQKMMVPGAPVKPVPWSKGASAPAGAASGANPAASAASAAPSASAASAQ